MSDFARSVNTDFFCTIISLRIRVDHPCCLRGNCGLLVKLVVREICLVANIYVPVAGFDLRFKSS